MRRPFKRGFEVGTGLSLISGGQVKKIDVP
jgi:hypothetical protein